MLVPFITEMQRLGREHVVVVGGGKLGLGRIKSPGQWYVGLVKSREGHREMKEGRERGA